MYAFFKGIIDEVCANYIVLNCENIGYLIYTPNPYTFSVGEKYTVYTYLHVREDVMDLYGFKTKEERDLFLDLISVKGLGPKMALPILAAGSVSGVKDAINKGDTLYLQKFPKIGPKLAQQIILDLKGKIDVTEEITSSNPEIQDVVEALLSLGYKMSEIKKIISKIDLSLSLDERVKQALQLLLK